MHFSPTTPENRWSGMGAWLSLAYFICVCDRRVSIGSWVMGGICSRKRDQHVVEDDLHRGISGRYCRSGSIKWSRPRSLRSKSNQCPGVGTCPSLMDLCINRIREVHVFFHLVFFFFLILLFFTLHGYLIHMFWVITGFSQIWFLFCSSKRH